jgi:hypothetical protein
MAKVFEFVLLSILVVGASAAVRAQENTHRPTNDSANQKTLIVAKKSASDAIIAIPPITLARIDLWTKKKRPADAFDVGGWIARESALNGLESPDMVPWHIVVTYDEFDEDGDNVHSGVYEEYWVSEKKYKRSYKSDNFN